MEEVYRSEIGGFVGEAVGGAAPVVEIRVWVAPTIELSGIDVRLGKLYERAVCFEERNCRTLFGVYLLRVQTVLSTLLVQCSTLIAAEA